MVELNPELIKNIQYFNQLGDKQIQAILDAPENGLEEYAPKSIIFQEHEIGEYMYIMLEGLAEVFVTSETAYRDISIATIKPGDLFGESSATSEEESRRTATVKVALPTKVFKIHKKYVLSAIYGIEMEALVPDQAVARAEAEARAKAAAEAEAKAKAEAEAKAMQEAAEQTATEAKARLLSQAAAKVAAEARAKAAAEAEAKVQAEAAAKSRIEAHAKVMEQIKKMAKDKKKAEAQKPAYPVNDVSQMIVKLPIFKGLTPEELASINDWAQADDYQKNEFIYAPGSTAENLYIVLEGAIDVVNIEDDGNFKIYSTEIPGGYFGELELLPDSDGKYSNFVRVKEDSRIIKIQKKIFDALIERNDTLIEYFKKIHAVKKMKLAQQA